MTNEISTAILKDVVAYVDVWSTSMTEDYSDVFVQQLRDMGAQVPKTFCKKVTHVVFKHGHQSTWNKAKKMGVKIVSVQWVARCKENAEHADEDLYPAQHDMKKRRHHCMQPRHISLSSPKQVKRKRDKMMEGLVHSSPIVLSPSPFIIDEENGIVYSPSLRRADTMAQRLKEMRALHENLSASASQIQDSDQESDQDCATPLGETSTNLFKKLSEEEGEPSNVLDIHPCSQTDEKKEDCDQPSTSTASVSCVANTSHDLTAKLNSNVKEPIKSPKSQRKKARRSCSGITKQSSLDSYLRQTSSKKSASTGLTPKDEKLIKSDSKKRKSMSALGKAKSQINPIPICLKEAKANSETAASRKCSFVDTFCSEKDCLAQTTDMFTQKPSEKVVYYGMPTADADTNDDNLFEDFFASTKNTPGHRVVIKDSSEKVPLPSFDLEPLNRNRRKSHHQEPKTGNIKRVDSSGPARVTNEMPVVKDTSDPVCEFKVVSEIPKLEELKQEPAAKRRKATQQNSVTHSESKDSKSTSDGLTDSCSEMCSKQGTMKTDKYMKKNRTLVMTSMPTEKQETVLQVVNSLGGFTVVDTVCESTTHVVSGSPRRTLNVLLGIARGCWILSFEWILWCLEHRQWIPEEPYELSDHFPAAPICRLQQHLSAGEHQQDLFQDQPLMFVSPLSQPPCYSLVELIQLCGGTVCRSIRQAGICIGEYKGKKPEETKSLSEQWILDCVTHLMLLPYDNYILE